MRRITATLPTLGTVAVDFHAESDSVATFMGDKEWQRLRSVPHLGVAASVFTGVNHSRLEYVLLQCAVAGLVAKLHRNDEQFALSNSVSLNGLGAQVSSGEELIKSWILLSNIGHAQYTYGVERALLQQASDDPQIKSWLTQSIRHADLRRWAVEVIDHYRYTYFRYLLTLLRISQLPARDRRKSRFAHYIRNLVLPLPSLFPNDPACRYKVRRLRMLFGRIRLLSMVALDAHYSHHPISINLNSAILGLADLLPTSYRESGFDQLLRTTAGWLADELYFHPTAVSAQRNYELRFARRFPRRFDEASTGRRLPMLLQELMTQGLGPPHPHALCHLVRFSLPGHRPQLLGTSTPYETIKQLERELASPPMTSISIDTNPFTDTIHLDFLYKPNQHSLTAITRLYTKLYKWFLRTVEADSLVRIRRIFPHRYRGNTFDMQETKRLDLQRQARRYAYLLQRVFDSIIASLLPDDRKPVISDFTATSRATTPVVARFILDDQTVVDTASDRFSEILEQNPEVLPQERLQEVRCLKHIFEETTAPFVLACPEKFVVKDLHGRNVDEWDGIQISLTSTRLTLTVIEAKTGGTATQRENDAFRQLDATRRLILSRHSLRYRRKRISGMGALIDFYCDA